MEFDLQNISVASRKAKSSYAKHLKKLPLLRCNKKKDIYYLSYKWLPSHSTPSLFSQAAIIMSYVEFHLVQTSAISKFLFGILHFSHNSLY